jgi:hypothetical protein
MGNIGFPLLSRGIDLTIFFFFVIVDFLLDLTLFAKSIRK